MFNQNFALEANETASISHTDCRAVTNLEYLHGEYHPKFQISNGKQYKYIFLFYRSKRLVDVTLVDFYHSTNDGSHLCFFSNGILEFKFKLIF